MAEPHPSDIADYALIGDCETAALVGRDASIDWLCWPRFDSDACFAALLGDASNGRWLLAPAGPARASRRYRPGALILETSFETEAGAAEVIDFMPPRSDVSHLVRLVRGRRGRLAMRMELILRFGYGQTIPWVRKLGGRTLSAVAGPSMAILRSSVETRGEAMSTVAEFQIAEGETHAFVLTHQASHLPPPAAIDPMRALAETERFWRGWDAKSDVKGPYEAAVRRSLMVLKAMTFAPTGAIVAAPTTSLPEKLGGQRNWDYRFCWIRDASLTLLALMNGGHREEAGAWLAWLQRSVAGDPADMRIMYGLGGERRLSEWEVDWLPGYAGSSPVRIGNAAHDQFQLDVYGELMDAFHQARCVGLDVPPAFWDLERALMGHVAKVWNEPDEGVWEVRGGRKRFTYSRVMAWVAFDRAIKSAERFGLEGPVGTWRELRNEVAEAIWAEGFDKARNTFTQAFGEAHLDASLLRLAQVGFVEPDDPAFLGTVAAIERELVEDGFVQRYRTEAVEDGLPPGEGAFLACSFWLVDAYAMTGRQDEAHRLFERLLGVCNDVGLMAEEYDPRARRFTGNFPQAFSHLALVNAQANLVRDKKPNEQRPAKS